MCDRAYADRCPAASVGARLLSLTRGVCRPCVVPQACPWAFGGFVRTRVGRGRQPVGAAVPLPRPSFNSLSF
jgi:hypothetical protein